MGIDKRMDIEDQMDIKDQAAGSGSTSGLTAASTRKKPGPVPGPPMNRYNILLEEELGEWGKRQPGGLSGLIRRLLKEEREKKERVTARPGLVERA